MNIECDFCEYEVFEDGDTESVAFTFDDELVIWCGLCRGGSEKYFYDLPTPLLQEAVLKAHSKLGTYEETEETHYDRVILEDEIFRILNEIAWRMKDV